MESPQVNSVFRNIDIMNEIGQIGQMVPIPPKYDMVSIALQGIGHVFGLGHPSVREAIMYAYMDDKKCFFFCFFNSRVRVSQPFLKISQSGKSECGHSLYTFGPDIQDVILLLVDLSL